MNETSNKSIERACGIVGGQAVLAVRVGVTPQAVNKWVRTGRVPGDRVLSVEAATDRKVTRYDLRPDLYPKDESAAA